VRKGIPVLALSVAMLLTAGSAMANDVQKIVDKYIEATGGEDNWENIESRKSVGNIMVVAMGMSGTMTQLTDPPNSLSVMALDGFGEFLSGIHDGIAWSSNMMQGDVLLEGEAVTAAKREADPNMWLRWEEYYPSASVEGEEEINGSMATKVTFTPEEGDAITYWFDNESGLIVQSYGPGLGGPQTTVYSDYKEVDGLKIPHKLSMEGTNGPVEVALETVEINPDIEAGAFDPPASIQALIDAQNGEEGSDEKEGSEQKEGSDEK